MGHDRVTGRDPDVWQDVTEMPGGHAGGCARLSESMGIVTAHPRPEDVTVGPDRDVIGGT